MVYVPSTHAILAAVAAVVLPLQQAEATSLQYDPTTTCTLYDLNNKNFPGRGTEVDDDGTCTVTVPENPILPSVAAISSVPVVYEELLSNKSMAPVEPVFTKIGKIIVAGKLPSDDTNQDTYTTVLSKDQLALLGLRKTNRKLEATTTTDIAKLESYFNTPMETKLKNLPVTVVYHSTPWAGPNWEKYRDSINYEWNKGQPSAAEKYATAFGLDVVTFMNNVSADNGIDSMYWGKVCTTDNECFDPAVDTVCAIRRNATSGRCIPTWFGICHAWSPAAIFEKEPNCPVVYNGVTFQPMDIKALITDVYDYADMSAIFAGNRFNPGNDSVDQYGRHTNFKYRDLNPGFFHVVAANLLGLLNTTFIIDRDAGAEVWNQPVLGFKVYEQTNMTMEKAAQAFYGLEKYPWNQNASSIVYVKSRLSWINETFTDGGLVASGRSEEFTVGRYYDYLLELNEADEIIGGEWLYDSNDNHPDFLWLAEAKPAVNTTTTFGLTYANVTILLEKATASSDSESK